jgi:hypothetical protein
VRELTSLGDAAEEGGGKESESPGMRAGRCAHDGAVLSEGGSVMAVGMSDAVETGAVDTDVAARLDRLPWSRISLEV